MEEIQRQDFLNFYNSQISLGNQASLIFCSAFRVYYFFLQVVSESQNDNFGSRHYIHVLYNRKEEGASVEGYVSHLKNFSGRLNL